MKREIGKEYLLLLLRAGGFFILMWLLFSRVFFLTRVQGMDMAPALKDGDLAFGVRIGQQYKNDDVLLYEEDEKLVFGRVTGEAEEQENAWTIQKVAVAETGNTEEAQPSDTEEPQENQETQVLSRTQIKGKVLTILRRRV